jgi:hypothetical protein
MKFVPETRSKHYIINLRFYQTRYLLLHNEKILSRINFKLPEIWMFIKVEFVFLEKKENASLFTR